MGRGLRIALVGPDGERVGVQVSGWGGGDRLQAEVGCESTLGPPWKLRSPRQSPVEREHLTLSVDLSRTAGDLRCTLRPGVEGHRNVPLERWPEGGAWALEITATDHGGAEAPAAAEAILVSLTLEASGLVVERPGASPPDPVAQAVSLVTAGDVAAGRALQALPASADLRRAAALRAAPDVLAGPLREAVGRERYYALFDRAFTVPIDAHPDDQALGVTLTTALPDVEALLSAPDPASRARGVRLLAARGRAWVALGRPAAARRDLLAVSRAPAPHGPLPDPIATVWLDLAALEARDGRDDAALDDVRHGLGASSAPEILADRVRAMPALAALAQRPAWVELLPP
ncbi:MAG: hypothetical protein R3F59_16160 [Myxococcota bacterium]